MIDVFLVQAEIDLLVRTDWERDLFMAGADTVGTGGMRPKALSLGRS